MLEDFSLVHKRNMIRYNVDWDKHFIMTSNRTPSHIVLNIENLIKAGPDKYEVLAQDIWEYLNPSSSSASS